MTVPMIEQPADPDTRSPDSPVVVVDGVWKRFGATDVVQGLSFEIRAGEILGFLGPNGAGKTTTMRMILDIIRPDAGSISVFGRPPGVEHRSRVGYLPEERGLYRDVPVLDTLTYFGALRGLSSAEARSRATRLLTEVGLGDDLRKKAVELSRGMHQKAQVIATVLHEPDLLIVDEPMQGLDPVNAEMLKGLLVAQRDRGAAVVMSTHDMADAQTLCDRILLIDGGRRLLYGSVKDIQSAFSDGAVEVRGSGVSIDAEHYRSVAHAAVADGGVRFLLRDGVPAQELFRELATDGAAVERFEVSAPTLNEIFLRTVAGDERASAVG